MRIDELLKMFPGLAEAVANASREKMILDGMPPEVREAMEPAVRSIVRSDKVDGTDEKAPT